MRLHGGCGLLVEMLAVEGGSEADDARINACSAVQELSVGNTANQEMFASSAMGTLVTLMASESQHVQEAASAALSAVLDGSQVANAAARGAGGLEALLSLLQIRNNRCRAVSSGSPEISLHHWAKSSEGKKTISPVLNSKPRLRPCKHRLTCYCRS